MSCSNSSSYERTFDNEDKGTKENCQSGIAEWFFAKTSCCSAQNKSIYYLYIHTMLHVGAKGSSLIYISVRFS